jgi:hypothetical protein
MLEKPKRRMTLQELLVHVEKYSHDFEEYMRINVHPCLGDLREMSRPKRKHSNYPTVIAVQNSVDNLRTTADEVRRMTDVMMEWFAQLDDHVQRARGI